MVNLSLKNNALTQHFSERATFQFVLFGLRPNLAAYLERSPLDHSYRYAPADDRPSDFASLTLTPEPFMQFAG